MPEFIKANNINIAKYGNGSTYIIGIHGWAGAYSDLHVFGEWLDKEKYTLYAIEIPGRGNSVYTKKTRTINDLIHCVNEVIEFLGIQNFVFISDFGFSQVTIRFAYLFPTKVNGMLFIYMPLIVPSLIKLQHRIYAYPFIGIYSKTRKLDWTINMLRNSDKVMHRVFIRSDRPEAIELELLDISNKRKADLDAIFSNAWDFLNSKVITEWKNISCPIEVVVAEKDEILSLRKGMYYLKMNNNANITIIDKNHNWDFEFIQIMRQRLLNLI